MSKTGYYHGYLRHNDVLPIPLYNAVSADCFIERIDSTDATGTVEVRTIMPKTYDYDVHVLYADNPDVLYGFPTQQQVGYAGVQQVSLPLSTTVSAKEDVSGRAVGLSAALGFGNYTVARLNSLMLMITPSVVVNDTYTGITGNDNIGAGWSWESWIYITSNGLKTLYLETNNAVTSYFAILYSAAGHLQVQHSGATVFTDTLASLLLNTWHHVAIVCTGTQITAYKDGVADTTVAYTHGTYTGIGANYLNYASGAVTYLQSPACYHYALGGDVPARHYREITDSGGSPGDFQPAQGWQASSIGRYGGVSIVYTNTVPAYSSTNYTGNTVIQPLSGVSQIIVSSGTPSDVWYYAIHTVEEE